MKPLFYALLALGGALTLGGLALGSPTPVKSHLVGNRTYRGFLKDGDGFFEALEGGVLRMRIEMKGGTITRQEAPIGQASLAERLRWAQTMWADMVAKPEVFKDIFGDAHTAVLGSIGTALEALGKA